MKTPFAHLSSKLMAWYKRAARDLPWRRTSDPYRIWISEVMLQQTTVSAVISYYERWVERYPDIHSLARDPLTSVLKMWQGLGYYSRARNLHAAACRIVADHDGKFPADKEVLRRLPGLGPYTVGAVLSIAFDQREPIIDANVRRVVMRLLAIEGYPDPGRDHVITEFLLTVMPKSNNRIFNQALMELGALICRSKNPSCQECPLRMMCRARKKGIENRIPLPKVSQIKNLSVAIGIISQNGKYLMQKRPPGGLFADLWEFPGGKIERGETPQVALERELEEELGIKTKAVKHLFNVSHSYTVFKANLSVWRCEMFARPQMGKHRKWLKIDALEQYPMPAGTVRIVDRLLSLEE